MTTRKMATFVSADPTGCERTGAVEACDVGELDLSFGSSLLGWIAVKTNIAGILPVEPVKDAKILDFVPTQGCDSSSDYDASNTQALLSRHRRLSSLEKTKSYSSFAFRLLVLI